MQLISLFITFCPLKYQEESPGMYCIQKYIPVWWGHGFAWLGGLEISNKLVIEGTDEEGFQSVDGEEELGAVEVYMDWSRPAEITDDRLI